MAPKKHINKKGAGPRAARHIPWPELYTHHHSLLEGHYKFLELIRQHTKEHSNNYRNLTGMVDRAQDIVEDNNRIFSKFLPPSHPVNKIALGASSTNKHHRSLVDENGGELKSSNGPAAANSTYIPLANGSGSQAASRTANGITSESSNNDKANGNSGDEEGNASAYFVFDINPTPSAIPANGHSAVVAKNDTSVEAEQQQPKAQVKKKSKKSKSKTATVEETVAVDRESSEKEEGREVDAGDSSRKEEKKSKKRKGEKNGETAAEKSKKSKKSIKEDED